MSEALVHIDQFRMDFGDKTVIRNLSCDVGRGETFGFLGSNGSGKTTTIRALLGIYQPTAGTLYIAGRPFRPEDGGRLGYLPEERGLYKKEKVLDIMTYFGQLRGASIIHCENAMPTTASITTTDRTDAIFTSNGSPIQLASIHLFTPTHPPGLEPMP